MPPHSGVKYTAAATTAVVRVLMGSALYLWHAPFPPFPDVIFNEQSIYPQSFQELLYCPLSLLNFCELVAIVRYTRRLQEDCHGIQENTDMIKLATSIWYTYLRPLLCHSCYSSSTIFCPISTHLINFLPASAIRANSHSKWRASLALRLALASTY